MDSQSIRDLVLRSLDDHKAGNVVAMDVRHLTDMTDFMVMATGGSTRQAKALAKYLIEDSRKAGCQVMGVEGLEQADWVLVDLVDVVVHVMVPETRELYRLEELWTDPAALSL